MRLLLAATRVMNREPSRGRGRQKPGSRGIAEPFRLRDDLADLSTVAIYVLAKRAKPWAIKDYGTS